MKVLLSKEVGTTHSWKDLAEGGLQACKNYCIKPELKRFAWEVVWYSSRSRLHPCTGNACSHLWVVPLPRHHPQDGDGTRGWDISLLLLWVVLQLSLGSLGLNPQRCWGLHSNVKGECAFLASWFTQRAAQQVWSEKNLLYLFWSLSRTVWYLGLQQTTLNAIVKDNTFCRSPGNTFPKLLWAAWWSSQPSAPHWLMCSSRRPCKQLRLAGGELWPKPFWSCWRLW